MTSSTYWAVPLHFRPYPGQGLGIKEDNLVTVNFILKINRAVAAVSVSPL